jgi:hypothetical protein
MIGSSLHTLRCMYPPLSQVLSSDNLQKCVRRRDREVATRKDRGQEVPLSELYVIIIAWA